MYKEGDEIHLDVTEARGADSPGIMRYVLLISLALAILILSIIWISGAVSVMPADGDPVTAEEYALSQ